MNVSKAEIEKKAIAKRPILAWIAGVLLFSLGAMAARCDAGILFNDVTKETGITFLHTDGSGGNFYVMETVTAGLALFDYDADGDIDIYFLNGSPLKGTASKTPPKNALYRNDGGWKFTDVTERSGLGDTGYGLGVAVGDYDGDGDGDVYLNNHGPNVLYRNNGDGTFADVTAKAGVANGDQMGAGACFLDMDGDGDLDLYVSNYLMWSYEKNVVLTTGGISKYEGPPYYPPVADTLYRNNGDGTFSDVSKESGIGEHIGAGMGLVAGDYDLDGDTDIFIANDISVGNFLFKNDGSGKFEEIGLQAGAAYDLHGDEQGSMGVDAGDYDNDGIYDFYVTSYQRQPATLYKGLGDDTFEDVTRTTGAGAGTVANVTWGTGFVDFDNDGDRDIFVACGHLQPNIEQYDGSSTYLQTNILLMNTGDGKFTDVSESSGPGMKVKLSSRGAGFDDMDNDGDIDVVILNSRAEPTILRNDSPSQGHWLQIRLKATKTNSGGIGANVKLVAGDLTLIDEVHSGRSYQSHYGTRLHFGLGDRDKVDRIEVRWIGGDLDVFENIPANRLITLTEGEGKAE
ncbi:MAG: CRTAC1 family protein [Planctomycetota bacterium]|jgi:hypothetical protein